MSIPFAKPDITEAEIEAVADCMRSGWLTSGPNVQAFEKAFSSAVNSPHAIAVNSATAGALLLMQAAGVGPGTSVVFPTYTFSGPAMMAHHLGAEVILVDSEAGFFEPSHESILAAVRQDTVAVFVTHFAGVANYSVPVLRERLPKHVKLFDDAAHAFPATYALGRPVGCEGMTDGTIFSFYATKCITTGEGGMVTCQDPELDTKIRALRLHGFDRDAHDRYTNLKSSWAYNVGYEGWKANMTDTAAAMGLVQLARSPEMHRARQGIANRYFMHLKTVKGISHVPVNMMCDAVHLFPIRVHGRRDEFVQRMRELGVHCSVHFIPLHMHSAWKDILHTKKQFPNAEHIFSTEVSLPIYSTMTDDDVDMVIFAVKQAASELY